MPPHSATTPSQKPNKTRQTYQVPKLAQAARNPTVFRTYGGTKNFIRTLFMVLSWNGIHSEPIFHSGDKLDIGRQLKNGTLFLKMPKIAQYPFIGRHLAKYWFMLYIILVANHSHGRHICRRGNTSINMISIPWECQGPIEVTSCCSPLFPSPPIGWPVLGS